MGVTIVGSSIAEEAVGNESYLKSLVTDELFAGSSLETSSKVIQHVLHSLQKRLSKYKYIVQVTSAPRPGTDVDVDVLIKTLFGAAWESKRDGCITLKYEADTNEEITFVTIYWVYADWTRFLCFLIDKHAIDLVHFLGELALWWGPVPEKLAFE